MFDQVLIVVEVVIGLAFIFYVFSLLVQGGTGLILKWLNLSAKDLENGLRELLLDTDKFNAFIHHPRIQNLMKKRFLVSTSNDILDYVPPKAFTEVFLDIFIPEPGEETAIASAVEKVQSLKIDDKYKFAEDYKKFLIKILKKSDKNIQDARDTLEEWFDEKMTVVSDIYTRQAKTIAMIAGLLIAFLLGIDTIRLADYLWRVPTARAVVIERADATLDTQQTDTEAELTALMNADFPLFWDSAEFSTPTFGWTWKLIGLSATGAAISQGSSFWYNVIKSLRGAKEERSEDE